MLNKVPVVKSHLYLINARKLTTKAQKKIKRIIDEHSREQKQERTRKC